MKKAHFLLAIAFLLFIPLFGVKQAAAATYFTDVGTTHRAAEEINYLAEKGIVTGTADHRFLPKKTVTRAEAAAMIGRALKLNGTQRSTSFRDVPASSFASGYIQSAVEKGYLSGYSDGTFHPEKTLKRGEMALMINKAFHFSSETTTGGAAETLIKLGIAQGKGDGTFGLDDPIIRADFAVFLAGAMNPDFRVDPSNTNTVQFTQPFYVNVASNDKLNVRKGPSTNYAVIGTLTRGTKVYAANKVNGWYYIKSGSLIGYVNGAYLQSTPPSSTGQYDRRLSSQVIIIDPGHGGTDPGAIGYGLKEKDVVLDTGLRLRNVLAKSPFQVKMTRSTDTFISLQGRVNFAIRNKGNVFLSIHANAGGGTGSETYYWRGSGKNPYKADSQLLATKIENRLHSAMGIPDRGVNKSNPNGDLHVLRENNMPAMLAELGFIDNPSDNAKLASATWRQKAANAIYLGLLDYYQAKGYNVSSLYNLVNR
ncbi:N-acetylmuramoyl-L-alanine amidase [Bacillus smithii]|uniref:N-acetylmuramoyl-L-alanine amidase n=1 Tax=Bacillus smithii TaxID=1479 RepID=UPI002E1C6B6A|nr:N-acetylmuramoyl-L-alanine amidase [Bacillus smithii]MED4926377.1 N-acetylmuramoyl-L-alanine amidase [Bacillus smithii]